MKNLKTSKLVYLSLLISLALVLSLIERTMPLPFTTPGAKLGLSNLVIILAVYTLDNYHEAFLVLILKIFLSGLLGGNLSSLMYSFSGGVLSFLITLLVKNTFKEYVSIIGVSASAAVFHNIGQLLVASLILDNLSIFLYLPMLTIIGIITGIFIGLSANYILNHFKKLNLSNLNQT